MQDGTVLPVQVDAQGRLVVENRLFQLATAKPATGTAVDFTGIPSWAKRVTVILSGVSTNGSSAGLLRVGTSSGVISTGYTSGATVQGGANIVSGANATTGLLFSPTPGPLSVASGSLTLLCVSESSWVFSFCLGFTDTAYSAAGGGAISLPGALDRVRITTANGTDTFDAGVFSILCEG
jgi:hypothetical protein